MTAADVFAAAGLALILGGCGREDGPAAGPAAPGPPYNEASADGRYVPCPEGSRPVPGERQMCVPEAAVRK